MQHIEQAMIFAAGLGTRLRSLTGTLPKALIEVAGKTMLERVIEKLKASGVQRIVINLHHFPNLIRTFVNQHDDFGVEILFSDESDLLLETGGGLKKAIPFFDRSKPVLIHNVDVISDIDLTEMLHFHLNNNALATLFVQKRKSARFFLFDENLRLSGWRNATTGEEIIAVDTPEPLNEFAFNGIHLISPELFDLISEDARFSIVQVYLRLASGGRIFGFRADDVAYVDIGKPESLKDAEKLLSLI